MKHGWIPIHFTSVVVSTAVYLLSNSRMPFVVSVMYLNAASKSPSRNDEKEQPREVAGNTFSDESLLSGWSGLVRADDAGRTELAVEGTSVLILAVTVTSCLVLSTSRPPLSAISLRPSRRDCVLLPIRRILASLSVFTRSRPSIVSYTKSVV